MSYWVVGVRDASQGGDLITALGVWGRRGTGAPYMFNEMERAVALIKAVLS